MAALQARQREPGSREDAPATRPMAVPVPQSVQQILALQRSAGNAAVSALIARSRDGDCCRGGCGGTCGGQHGSAEETGVAGGSGGPSVLDSILDAGQQVGEQVGGFVSDLLGTATGAGPKTEEPGHEAESEVGERTERAAAMLAGVGAGLAGVESVSFTAAEIATIASCTTRLREHGIDVPEIAGSELTGEDMFVVSAASLAALTTAIPIPIPIVIPLPLILIILALLMLLLFVIVQAIERERERERERRRRPPCRDESDLLADVGVLLDRVIEEDAVHFLRYYIGRDPTLCSKPSNQRRMRINYFFHMLRVCQVGVMQACDRNGRYLASSEGVKGVGSGGTLHAEDLALRSIEPRLLAIPMSQRAGGTLWSVTIDRACGRCNPMVTGAATTLLAGTPVFAHLGRKFAEVRRRSDPAIDRAWAMLCTGAPGQAPAPAPTGMFEAEEDPVPDEFAIV